MKRHTQGLLVALALVIALRLHARYALFLAAILLLFVGLPLGIRRYGFWKTYAVLIFGVTLVNTLMLLTGDVAAASWHSQLSDWALVAIVSAYTLGLVPRSAVLRIGLALSVAGSIVWEGFQYWTSYSGRVEVMIFSLMILLPGCLALYRVALGRTAIQVKRA